MKLNEVVTTENAFTDWAKKQAFNLTGQQTGWGRQGLDLQTKDLFISKVSNFIKMNLTSASETGVQVDTTYIENLLNGYLKKQGLDGIPSNWSNSVKQIATKVAKNDKNAINQLANIVYQVISSESPATVAQPTSTQQSAQQTTQPVQSTQNVNQVVGLIRQLATQGNVAGLQTILNAANRSLSRLTKQQTTQQTTTPPTPGQQNVPPISIGGNPITPGHPSYERMASAAQRAGAVPESKNPAKLWTHKDVI
jgi:hypothetical protein